MPGFFPGERSFRRLMAQRGARLRRPTSWVRAPGQQRHQGNTQSFASGFPPLESATVFKEVSPPRLKSRDCRICLRFRVTLLAKVKIPKQIGWAISIALLFLMVYLGYTYRDRIPAYLASLVPGRWQVYQDPAHSFQVEFPGDPRSETVQVTREDGGLDSVAMEVFKPEGKTSFSCAFADHPPVAQVNQGSMDATFDLARDQAIRKTGGANGKESRAQVQGYPARDLQWNGRQNSVIDARLVYVGPRLYMLTVISPSPSQRIQGDVDRFFNSLRIFDGKS